jgi:hypothetical protein
LEALKAPFDFLLINPEIKKEDDMEIDYDDE